MLESVDSLWNDLQFIKSQFTFKMDEFVERKTDMEKQLIKAQFLDASKLSEEDRINFDKYNSVYRVYKKIGASYKQSVLTAEDIFYAIKGLEKQVKEGTYDAQIEVFKQERAALKVRLDKNTQMAIEVSQKLSAVEPLYLRTHEIIDNLLDTYLPEKP